jgi:hypothetical protein
MTAYLLAGAGLGLTLLFCVFTIVAGHYFRELIDYLHAEHHDQWMREGKPDGGPGTRREIGFWNLGNSTVSGLLMARHWHRNAPSWAIGDLQAITWLSKYRHWWSAAKVMLIGAMLVFAIFFAYLEL